MALAGNDLAEYYKLNFILRQEHNWSITEIEDMSPFERDIYVYILQRHIQKKNEENNN